MLLLSSLTELFNSEEFRVDKSIVNTFGTIMTPVRYLKGQNFLILGLRDNLVFVCVELEAGQNIFL